MFVCFLSRPNYLWRLVLYLALPAPSPNLRPLGGYPRNPCGVRPKLAVGHPSLNLGQTLTAGLANFFYSGSDSKCFSFISVILSLFLLLNSAIEIWKQATNYIYVNEFAFVSINLYLKKWAAGHYLALGHRLPTPGLWYSEWEYIPKSNHQAVSYKLQMRNLLFKKGENFILKKCQCHSLSHTGCAEIIFK